MLEINSTCCFTGHRKICKESLNQIASSLENTVSMLYGEGYRNFLTGGAVGFDLLAAKTILDFKKSHDNVKLCLFLPCIDYRSKWTEIEKELYRDIDDNADEIVYFSEEYTTKCMQLRNIQLVNNSSVCVAYLNKKSGGTAFTVKNAMKNGLRIINLGCEENVEYIFDPLLRDNLRLF